MADGAGMLAQDSARLEAQIQAIYRQYQSAKIEGMVSYVLRRGPDHEVRSWRSDGKPTRYRYAGLTWREVGGRMYGEDFEERLAVRLDSLHAERVR